MSSMSIRPSYHTQCFYLNVFQVAWAVARRRPVQVGFVPAMTLGSLLVAGLLGLWAAGRQWKNHLQQEVSGASWGTEQTAASVCTWLLC